MQLAAVDLGADPDDGSARIEGVREELEHGGAPLEHVEQVLARFELGAARVAEQACRAADEELRPVVCDRVDERCAEPAEERPLARGSIGSSSRRRSVAEPRRRPTACSSRYVRAQSTSPGSTGCSSSSTRFVTPPVEVITTTITARGWSCSTSTCRTDAAPSAGAETRARSRVACESASVVDRRVCSSSLRTVATSNATGSGRPSIASTSCSA